MHLKEELMAAGIQLVAAETEISMVLKTLKVTESPIPLARKP